MVGLNPLVKRCVKNMEPVHIRTGFIFCIFYAVVHFMERNGSLVARVLDLTYTVMCLDPHLN